MQMWCWAKREPLSGSGNANIMLQGPFHVHHCSSGGLNEPGELLELTGEHMGRRTEGQGRRQGSSSD